MVVKKYFTDEQRLEAKRKAAREWATRERQEFPERVKKRSERSRLRAFEEMRTNPSDVRHATEYGYSLGCRCKECNESHRSAAANRRERNRARDGRERYERSPDPRYAEVARLRTENVTNAEIARMLGYANRHVVGKIAARLGLPKRKAGRRKNDE